MREHRLFHKLEPVFSFPDLFLLLRLTRLYFNCQSTERFLSWLEHLIKISDYMVVAYGDKGAPMICESPGAIHSRDAQARSFALW